MILSIKLVYQTVSHSCYKLPLKNISLSNTMKKISNFKKKYFEDYNKRNVKYSEIRKYELFHWFL